MNCGDTTEGMSNREGHIIGELDRQRGIGITEQAEWFAECFQPFVDYGIPVYSIEAQGSHGGWGWTRSNQGYNIGKELAKSSSAYKFLGFNTQDFHITDNIKIRLRHPMTKKKDIHYPYSIPGGDKPNMILEGHWQFQGL